MLVRFRPGAPTTNSKISQTVPQGAVSGVVTGLGGVPPRPIVTPCSGDVLGAFWEHRFSWVGAPNANRYGHQKGEAEGRGLQARRLRRLYLYVMPSGYRSWRMKFRFAGKEKRLVFGSYPDTTLLQARTMRENAARLLRDGVDPSVHKVQQAAAQVAGVGATFKTIAEDWRSARTRPGRSAMRRT